MTTTNGSNADENHLSQAMAGRAPGKPDEPPVPRVDLNRRRGRNPWRLISGVLAVALLIAAAIAYSSVHTNPKPVSAASSVSTEQADTKAAKSAFAKYLKIETEASVKYQPSLARPYTEDDDYTQLSSFIEDLKKQHLKLVGGYTATPLSTHWSAESDTRQVDIVSCYNNQSAKLLNPAKKNVLVGRDGKPLPPKQKIAESMRSTHGGPWRHTSVFHILDDKC